MKTIKQIFNFYLKIILNKIKHFLIKKCAKKITKIKSHYNVSKNYTKFVECPNGEKHWYLNGKPHREDGPAVEWPNGYKEYWLNDKLLNKERIDFWLNLGYPIKTAIKLEYYYGNNKN